jgi:hypothetical protein
MLWRVLLVAACAAALVPAPACDGDGDADADADADADTDADSDADSDADDADVRLPCVDGDVCDVPPSSTCANETTVLAPQPIGHCWEGLCYYDTIDVPCEVPPYPMCDGDTLIGWESSGTCVGGQCFYDSVETECGDAGCCEDHCCP